MNHCHVARGKAKASQSWNFGSAPGCLGLLLLAAVLVHSCRGRGRNLVQREQPQADKKDQPKGKADAEGRFSAEALELFAQITQSYDLNGKRMTSGGLGGPRPWLAWRNRTRHDP